jgi:predicted transcriptional regulator
MPHHRPRPERSHRSVGRCPAEEAALLLANFRKFPETADVRARVPRRWPTPTVTTIPTPLVAKGFVVRELAGRRFEYRAALSAADHTVHQLPASALSHFAATLSRTELRLVLEEQL